MFRTGCTMFVIAAASAMGYKAGLHLWSKIETKFNK